MPAYLTREEQFQVYGHTTDGYAPDGRWLLPSERRYVPTYSGEARDRMERSGWPLALVANATINRVSDDPIKIREDLRLSPQSVARRYIKDYQEFKGKSMGLWLHGPTGSGKTYMGAAIALELECMGHRTHFTSWDDYFRKITDYRLAPEVYRLEQVGLLVLDDFGRSSEPVDSGKTTLYLSNLIRARTLRLAPTIITSNVNPLDISKAWGDAALSVIKSSMISIELDLPNRRTREDDILSRGRP